MLIQGRGKNNGGVITSSWMDQCSRKPRLNEGRNEIYRNILTDYLSAKNDNLANP